MKNENSLSTMTSKLPQLRRLPERMHIALADALARALSAIDAREFTTASLPSGAKAALERRRSVVTEVLRPAPRDRILVILASLSGMMARAESDISVATALARLDVADLADVPEFALVDAADAFRKGDVGEGRWRPTAGELRKEALRRASEAYAEAAKIDRVLKAAARAKPPGMPISALQWQELRSQLARGSEALTI